MEVIFMSGYLENDEGRQESIEASAFLEKPFTRESLLGKVNEALQSPSLEKSKKADRLESQGQLQPYLQ
jgi:DNA-binding NtrC family response regulator